jgi:hypothetical protein
LKKRNFVIEIRMKMKKKSSYCSAPNPWPAPPGFILQLLKKRIKIYPNNYAAKMKVLSGLSMNRSLHTQKQSVVLPRAISDPQMTALSLFHTDVYNPLIPRYVENRGKILYSLLHFLLLLSASGGMEGEKPEIRGFFAPFPRTCFNHSKSNVRRDPFREEDLLPIGVLAISPPVSEVLLFFACERSLIKIFGEKTVIFLFVDIDFPPFLLFYSVSSYSTTSRK